MNEYLKSFDNLLILKSDPSGRWAIIVANKKVIKTITDDRKYLIDRHKIFDFDGEHGTSYVVAVDTDALLMASLG
jgi:hypothetical protein